MGGPRAGESGGGYAEGDDNAGALSGGLANGSMIATFAGADLAAKRVGEEPALVPPSWFAIGAWNA